MGRNRSISKLARPLVVLSASGLIASHAHGGGLNTNVALTPPEDGFIIRTQWRHIEFKDEASLDLDLTLDVFPTTVVYGATADLAILGTVPIVHRDIDFGSGLDMSDTGVADLPLLAKYRFYQDDKRGQTTRIAAIGGLEIPTFDDTFSSESVDPIIGAVWTHQRIDWWVDADMLYKFNTGGGLDSDDELRGDIAYSQRLFGGENETIGPWGLYAIAELNASYLTDGSYEAFASPGLQYITPNFILEAGVQLPIAQDMKSPRLETDYTLVLSVRIQF